MKKQIHVYFTFAIVLLSLTASKAQLFPNPGFENWTLDTNSTFFEPDGWISNNYPPSASVVQTSGHSGSHAVRLKSIQSSPGTISGGQIDFFGPTNIKPLTISGFWKYLNAGTLDGLFIDMNVKSQGTTVGSVTAHTPGASLSNWAPFSATLAYTGANFPDYVTIIIYFSPTSTSSLNGYGDIDDLTLTYLAGINDTVVAKFPSANILPGTTSNNYRLLIDLLAGTKMTTQIFDLQGKMLNSQTENLSGGHQEIPVDFSEYAAGQYLYIVTLGGKVHHFKINKL